MCRATRGGCLLVFVSLVATPSSAQVEAERWTLAANLRQTFTDNLFLLEPAGPGESITAATISLAFSRIRPQSFFTAQGWASGSIFSRYSDYSAGQFGLGTSGQVGLSPRVRLRVEAAFADGLNLEAFYSSRLGTPQLDVKSGWAAGGFTFQFTPSTSAHATFDGSGIRFRFGQVLNSATLPSDILTPPDVLAPVGPGARTPALPAAPDSSQQALGFLSAEALQVSRLDYWTWHAYTGLAHEFSPRTQVTLDFGYRQTYQSPKALVEGDQLEAQAALREVLTNSARLSLAYGYQDSRFQFGFQTHSFTAQVEKKFSAEVKADASLGASYLDGPASVTSGWTLIGGAGLSMQFKRTLCAFRYTRTRYQGLITGLNQVTDTVYGNLGHKLARRASFALYSYYRGAQAETSPLFAYREIVAGTTFGVQIKKRGSAGLSYSFLQFHNPGRGTAQTSVVSLSVGYARTAR